MAGSEYKTYHVIFHYFNQDEAVHLSRIISKIYIFLLQVTIITSSGMSVLFLDLYFDFFFCIDKMIIKVGAERMIVQ